MVSPNPSKRLSNGASQPNPSSGPQGSAPRRALVLGDRGPANWIAERLRQEGFEPESAGEPLPSLSDPQALPKLKAILTRFAERVSPGDSSKDAAGGAPVLHPGVSVWAERAEIALLGEELGLDVMCPPARVLALFSNKLNLLTEADRIGIPHLVTSFDPINGPRELERLVFNQSLGRKPFPFVLKSVKGGGSFGLFVVQEPGDLESRIPLWVEQVRRNMGEVELFAERYLESARHILVPFVRYMDGRFRIFPMSDASLQCRYRKVVEFCPAGGIGPEMSRELESMSRKLAEHVGYVGVGTFEFLVDASRAYLVEASARLNTGFHLWERVAGTSAVSWQLSALEGGTPGEEPICAPTRDWAAGVALRLYAEDALLQLPQPGEVREVSERRSWRFEDPSVHAAAELDLQVQAGSRIESTDYGMLGMLWAGAEDSLRALHVARGALGELWIAGSIQTNERFLDELLAHPWVQEGVFHAGFVDEEFLPSVRPPAEVFRALQFVASEAASELPPSTGPADPITWAVGDQWVKPEAISQPGVSWHPQPQRWSYRDLRTGESWPGISGQLRLTDGRELRACAFPLAHGKWQVRLGQWVLPVRRVIRSAKASVPRKAPRLLALVQGRVHAILYRPGSVVPAHEPLLVLDSLGMLVPHAVPLDVRVTEWKKSPEEIVQAGEELGELELLKN